MDFNVSFIDRFVLFACFMAAAEIEKICNFFSYPPPDSCLIFELPHCHMLWTAAILSTMSAVMHTLNRGFCKQRKKLMM